MIKQKLSIFVTSMFSLIVITLLPVSVYADGNSGDGRLTFTVTPSAFQVNTDTTLTVTVTNNTDSPFDSYYFSYGMGQYCTGTGCTDPPPQIYINDSVDDTAAIPAHGSKTFTYSVHPTESFISSCPYTGTGAAGDWYCTQTLAVSPDAWATEIDAVNYSGTYESNSTGAISGGSSGSFFGNAADSVGLVSNGVKSVFNTNTWLILAVCAFVLGITTVLYILKRLGIINESSSRV
jgi:hypothetical protein